MPSDNHPNPGQPIPQTVHVALYEHRYGTDVRAFLDSEVVSRMWWKLPSSGLRACNDGSSQAARSRDIGSSG